jgi:hypothetical protein
MTDDIQKYTADSAVFQASAARVHSEPHGVRLEMLLSWEIFEWLAQVVVPAVGSAAKAYADRNALIDRSGIERARRIAQIEQNKIRLLRMARDARAELAQRIASGEERGAIVKDLSTRFDMPPYVLLANIARANREDRARANKVRDQDILDLHLSGRSVADIARYLECSPQHAGRLLRKALAQNPGATQ